MKAIERALVIRRIALRRALIDCRHAHGAHSLEGAMLEAQLVIDAVDEVIELELARMRLLRGEVLQ